MSLITRLFYFYFFPLCASIQFEALQKCISLYVSMRLRLTEFGLVGVRIMVTFGLGRWLGLQSALTLDTLMHETDLLHTEVFIIT